MKRLILSVTLATACSLCIAVPALALHRASHSTLRAIHAAVLPAGNSYFDCGRIAWARVSSAGPYAIVYVAARGVDGCRERFQQALLLAARSGSRWRLVADVLHEGCPRVPQAVLRDFRPYLMKRRLIGSGSASSRGCDGRIARS